MNLQGKTVKYNVPEGKRQLNNGQKSCPAIAVVDWSPDSDQVESKALNLRILLDGMEVDWDTSVHHVSQTDESNGSWELYKD